MDLLVNKAGTFDVVNDPLVTVSLAALRRMRDANFLGTLTVPPLLRDAPAERIVNLVSSPGSPTLNGDPASPYKAARFIGYDASEAALNMLSFQLHEVPRDTPTVVNSVSSGFVETNPTGHDRRGYGFRPARRSAARSPDGSSGPPARRLGEGNGVPLHRLPMGG